MVATTSGGVAATLGYEDHEGAPGDEMLAAAARIARAVDVPVTVDAEAGYGMEPAELVAALRAPGPPAATSRTPTTRAGSLRDPDNSHAEWLGAVREAASEDDYPLVINARIDVFVGGFPRRRGSRRPRRRSFPTRSVARTLSRGRRRLRVPDRLLRAGGAASLHSEFAGPVNVIRLPRRRHSPN